MTTRKDIRQRLMGVEYCGDGILSTVTALGTTTTLIDTTLKQPDDFFNYGQIVPITGTAGNIGAVRWVTDWVQSTSTFTVDRAWTSATAASDTYEIHRNFPYTNKNDAINGAILASGKRWPRIIDDNALITLDADTYTYNLSTLLSATPVDPILGLDWIGYDTGSNLTGFPYQEIPNSYYKVRNDDGVLTLQFLEGATIPDGELLRVIYRKRPPVLATDAAILTPDDQTFYNYVTAKACAILFRERMGIDPEGNWGERYELMEQTAELFFDHARPPIPPKAIRNEMLNFI